MFSSDSQPQPVLKVPEEKLDFSFRSRLGEAIASLQDIDQFRPICSTLFDITGGQLSPAIEHFSTKQAAGNSGLYVSHTVSFKKT